MHLFIQILLIIISYLLGGIPWGYIFGKTKGIDLREHGSKNIGTTNAGRVLGAKYAIYTYILDMIKGAIIVSLFTTGLIPIKYALFEMPIIYGLFAVIGHTFTPYLGFKGGKAVATGGGVILAISPLLFFFSVLVFILVVYFSSFVSLGSLVSAIFALLGSIVLYILNTYHHISNYFNIFFPLSCFLIALIIFIRHRGNIIRLQLKQENKIKWGMKKKK